MESSRSEVEAFTLKGLQSLTVLLLVSMCRNLCWEWNCRAVDKFTAGRLISWRKIVQYQSNHQILVHVWLSFSHWLMCLICFYIFFLIIIKIKLSFFCWWIMWIITWIISHADLPAIQNPLHVCSCLCSSAAAALTQKGKHSLSISGKVWNTEQVFGQVSFWVSRLRVSR